MLPSTQRSFQHSVVFRFLLSYIVMTSCSAIEQVLGKRNVLLDFGRDLE